MKKIIKLVNNERHNPQVSPAKGCESTSIDVCTFADYADCFTYAEDRCGKDYTVCSEGANDLCGNKDYTACVGPGGYDQCDYNDLAD